MNSHKLSSTLPVIGKVSFDKSFPGLVLVVDDCNVIGEVGSLGDREEEGEDGERISVFSMKEVGITPLLV